MLSIGIASTGIFTFAYLATASPVLTPAQYGRISLCWAIMFVILSVIYRPIEQLLSRTIADQRARGIHNHALRIPAAIQSGFALLFLIIALALRPQIENGIFEGSVGLYWILVIGVLAYAASYFARGWLAGHQRFALYGGLVFLESTSRFLFALAAAVGILTGQNGVGLGMAVAPFVSLSVIPFAFSRIQPGGPAGVAAADAAREGPAHAQVEEATTDLSLRRGAGFAVAVVGIMLAEQTLMNAGVLIVAANAKGGAVSVTLGLTGFVFNVMLIVRAPLQLFQAIQTSILPHLAGLEVREDADEFHRAIRVTILAIAAFARRRCARPAADRTGGDDRPARRQGLSLRALRARTRRPRDGPTPRLGHAQPGGAGARVRRLGVGGVADKRRAVRRVRRQHGDLERGHARRGRLFRRDRAAVL